LPTTSAAFCWSCVRPPPCAALFRGPRGRLYARRCAAGDAARSLQPQRPLGRAPVLAGYCGVHLLEHTLVPHFHFGEETHHHEFLSPKSSYSVLLGLATHTFFDGIAIGSGFVVSAWLGWVLFIAVFLHKIPEGFTVASVMLAGGQGRRTALNSALFLGATTVLGVLASTSNPAGSRPACRSQPASPSMSPRPTWSPK